MKIWTKLGLAALTLGVIAALVLTGGGAPRALAEHVTCAEWQQTCVEAALSVECEAYPELCYAECIIQEAYIDDGMDCGVCAQLDILIADVCGPDPECIAFYQASFEAEFGLNCNADTFCGEFTPYHCAAKIYDADDGGFEFCCFTCAGIPGCNSAISCTDQDQCYDYCASGGFNGGGLCGCGDDRVNQNCSAPEIVYCDGDTVKFYAYNYATLEAELDFTLSMADLQKSVEEKTLIKQDGTVKVYLMPDGRVLLVARQPDGKDYFMYWNPDTCLSLEESAQWNVQ